MKYGALTYVRFFVPGAMLYGLLASICWVTNWCELPFPRAVEEIGKLTLSLALAFSYLALGLRERMNEPYYDAVNKNLVSRLTAPFATDPTVPKPLTWRHIRPIFFRILDSDRSLTHQSNRAFANGALWTSAADMRAICLIGILLYSAAILVGNVVQAAKFDFHRAALAILVCLVLFSLSFWFSKQLTIRHIDIGNEQVDFILAHHRQALKQYLSQIVL